MKVIDSMWFSNMHGTCGLVVGENEMGERKLYAGVASGRNQKADEAATLAYGIKVNIGFLEALIAKVRKKS